MQPTTLQALGQVSDSELRTRRQDERRSYAAYFDAVLKALTPDVVEALEWHASHVGDGVAELSLYGRLAVTIDGEKLWKGGSGVNGDRSWAGGVGEQLVAIVHGDDRRFVHRLQEGKHDQLAERYNSKYEDEDAPKNYNYIWLWPIEEYTPVVIQTENFFQKRTINVIGVKEPDPELTLYEKVLTPEDIAKHLIFSQSGKRRIEDISSSVYRERKSLVDTMSRTAQANYETAQHILAILGKK